MAGGACGYGSLVDVQPFKARVTSVSPILFKNGQGCGACYMVKCLDKRICSTSAVTVIVTDECPGCSGTHFDLSGAAFGSLALPRKGGQLRNQGVLPIVYRRSHNSLCYLCYVCSSTLLSSPWHKLKTIFWSVILHWITLIMWCFTIYNVKVSWSMIKEKQNSWFCYALTRKFYLNL